MGMNINHLQKFKTFLNKLCEDKKEAIYYAQKDVASKLSSKNGARFFIDMLSQIFEDLIKLLNGTEILLKSQDELLLSLKEVIPNPSGLLVEILKMRNMLNLNVNVALLLDHLVYVITKE